MRHEHDRPSPVEEVRRPRSSGDQGLHECVARQPQFSATPRKWQRVLRWLLDGGSLNRWDAARELRDSCLNTTISQIEARGVEILREDETVPGAFGPVTCKRYRLAPGSQPQARALLGLSIAPPCPEPPGSATKAKNELSTAP